MEGREKTRQRQGRRNAAEDQEGEQTKEVRTSRSNKKKVSQQTGAAMRAGFGGGEGVGGQTALCLEGEGVAYCW